MSQTQPEVDQFDDFEMEVPQAAPSMTKEIAEQRMSRVDRDGNVGNTKIAKAIIDTLDMKVDEITESLISTDTMSDEFNEISQELRDMGNTEINRTGNLTNGMLNRTSIRNMRDNKVGNGGEIANSLSNLRQTVTNLDPNTRNKPFGKKQWFGLKSLPFGLGKKVDNYLQEYKTAESQIQDIVTSLSNGRDQLIQDNAYIDEDRAQMAKVINRIEQYAYIMKKLDERIEERLPEIEAQDKEKAEDIKQEILFPIRQKRQDLMQNLAVSMQARLALQVLKRNNLELIRGVDRATTTTVQALRTAVVVAEGLANQEAVLNQVTSVNEVTNKLIVSTSEQLNVQGMRIQKQATETAISIKTLDDSFANVFKAMDAMDKYRTDALPAMKASIDAIDQTCTNAKNYLSNYRSKNTEQFRKDLSQETKEPVDENGAVVIRKRSHKGK